MACHDRHRGLLHEGIVEHPPHSLLEQLSVEWIAQLFLDSPEVLAYLS
jgi:hypothetical protein